MSIVSKITSYAKAVPAGLKAARQELAKTAGAVTAADAIERAREPRAGRPKAAGARPKEKTARRAAPSTRAKGKRAKAKRAAATPKGRKAKRRANPREEAGASENPPEVKGDAAATADPWRAGWLHIMSSVRKPSVF